MKSVRASVLAAAIMATVIPLVAEQQAVTVPERARGAARVVVATVTETAARYEQNEFGDELIVTYAELAVEEALKGDAGAATLALEGGTVDGITMRVSSLPTLTRG